MLLRQLTKMRLRAGLPLVVSSHLPLLRPTKTTGHPHSKEEGIGDRKFKATGTWQNNLQPSYQEGKERLIKHLLSQIVSHRRVHGGTATCLWRDLLSETEKSSRKEEEDPSRKRRSSLENKLLPSTWIHTQIFSFCRWVLERSFRVVVYLSLHPPSGSQIYLYKQWLQKYAAGTVHLHRTCFSGNRDRLSRLTGTCICAGLCSMQIGGRQQLWLQSIIYRSV